MYIYIFYIMFNNCNSKTNGEEKFFIYIKDI